MGERIKKSKWIIGAMAALVSTYATAQQPVGPYIGLLAGEADISRDITDDYTHSVDKFTWGAFAGWQFNQNFGFEVGHLRPGKITESITDGIDTINVSARFNG